MGSRSHRVLLAAVALVAAGCQPRPDLEQAAASAEGRFARETLDLLLRHDVAAVAARMSPEVAAQLTPRASVQTLGEIPAGRSSAPRIVGADSSASGPRRRSQYVYEYAFPREYLLGDVVVESSGPQPVVVGLHLKRMSDSVERLNAFTWRGKRARHFVVLAAFVANVALLAGALVAWLRTGGRGKWLWLPFMLLGPGQVRFNWATGQHVVLPVPMPPTVDARVYRAGDYSPWIVSFTIPVGAIAFLLWRRRRERVAGAAP